MPTPPYGKLNRQPDNFNELKNKNFQFHIHEADHVNFFLVGANLPGLALGSVVQSTPLGPVPRAGDGVFEELQVQFIVDENLKNWTEIYEWIRSTTSLARRDEYDIEEIYRDGFLVLKSNSLNPTVKIQFKNLLPTSLSGLDLDARSSESEILISTVNFAYTEYDLEVL